MTTQSAIDPLQYPIGKFIVPETYSPEAIKGWIDIIRQLPANVRQATTGLTEEQLNTQYRPEGWTIRQVIHHLADSHMNSIIRFKWALTEDVPTIKPYHQTEWSELADYSLPIEPSLSILDGIHQHMVALFESFTDKEWNTYFIHPETGSEITLKRNLALYAWHSGHHLGHITNTVARF